MLVQGGDRRRHVWIRQPHVLGADHDEPRPAVLAPAALIQLERPVKSVILQTAPHGLLKGADDLVLPVSAACRGGSLRGLCGSTALTLHRPSARSNTSRSAPRDEAPWVQPGSGRGRSAVPSAVPVPTPRGGDSPARVGRFSLCRFQRLLYRKYSCQPLAFHCHSRPISLFCRAPRRRQTGGGGVRVPALKRGSADGAAPHGDRLQSAHGRPRDELLVPSGAP